MRTEAKFAKNSLFMSVPDYAVFSVDWHGIFMALQSTAVDAEGGDWRIVFHDHFYCIAIQP